MTWRSEALCTASGRTEKIRSDDSAHISCFTNHTSAQVNSGVVSWFASCFASRCRPVVVALIASSPPPTWNRYKKRPHLHHHFFLHRDRDSCHPVASLTKFVSVAARQLRHIGHPSSEWPKVFKVKFTAAKRICQSPAFRKLYSVSQSFVRIS